MADSTRFQPLPREATLSTRVVTQLEQMILSNELSPGAKLPPERELASQFGVSRTVVREAVTALTAKSWLEPAPGGGAIVKIPDVSGISQSMTLLLRAGGAEIPHSQILEVRRMLEVEIVGSAAERRSESDLERLESLLAAMKKLVGATDEQQLAAIMQNDVDFHATLAGATGNPLFVVMLNSIGDIMLAVRRLGMRSVQSHRNAVKYHTAILKAVADSEPETARTVMREHLDESEDTMRKAAIKLSKAQD